MTDQNQCCGTCAWRSEEPAEQLNGDGLFDCLCPKPDCACMIDRMWKREGTTCPTYKLKEQPMTDPLEQTEQQRQAIANALEELEAAANAWWADPMRNLRLIDAIDELREARKPKPSPLQRMQAIERAAYSALVEKENILNTLQGQKAATPEQLKQIEKWEREIVGKE